MLAMSGNRCNKLSGSNLFPFGRKNMGIALFLFATPVLLLAAKLIPLEVESKSTDMAGLRDAIIGGFLDIVQAELAGQ